MCIGVTMHDVCPSRLKSISIVTVAADDEWNFVYGIASPSGVLLSRYSFPIILHRYVQGTGLWSFSRLDPSFPDLDDKVESGLFATVLIGDVPWRSPINVETVYQSKRILIITPTACLSKVLCHEGTHMLGLQHCIYYTCLMNGIRF